MVSNRTVKIVKATSRQQTKGRPSVVHQDKTKEVKADRTKVRLQLRKNLFDEEFGDIDGTDGEG